MKMSKLYEVKFETKKGGYASWVIHIEESNLNAAKKKACSMWEEANKTAHMFHVRCRNMRYNEEFLYHWFKRIEK